MQERGHKAKCFENVVFLHTGIELYNTVMIFLIIIMI